MNKLLVFSLLILSGCGRGYYVDSIDTKTDCKTTVTYVCREHKSNPFSINAPVAICETRQECNHICEELVSGENMTLFGYTLVKTTELKAYKRAAATRQKLTEVHRWFSGWTDLDIIWEYLFAETYFGGISSCREKYADARKTNEYGKPLAREAMGKSK